MFSRQSYLGIFALLLFGSACSQSYKLALIPTEAQFELVSAPADASALSSEEIQNLAKIQNFSMGRQPLGTKSVYKVYLRNIGDLAGTVKKVSVQSSSASDVFGLTHQCGVIDGKANQLCAVELSFDPDTLGDAQAKLIVDYENGKGQDATIALPLTASANNLALLKFESNSVDLKTDTVGYSITSRIKVIYNGDHLKTNGVSIKPAMGVSVSDPTDGQFTIDPAGTTCGTTINADCWVGLKFSANSVGAQSGKLYLSYFNGSENLKITAEVHGTGVTAITLANLTASTVAFGNVVFNPATPKVLAANVTFTGSVPADQVVITPPSNSAFTMDTNPAVSTCLAATSISSNCVISFKFNPSSHIAYSDSIQIAYNSNGQTRTPLSIALTGTGVNPAVLTPQASTTLSFGNDPAHKIATKTLTFKNTGEVDVTGVSALTLSNSTDFQASLPGCNNLAPNGTCTMTVTFNPKAAAALSSTITFTYSDGRATQTITVNSDGTGTAPVVILSPNPGVSVFSVDFGNVLMGATAALAGTKTVTLGVYGTTSISTASQLVATPSSLDSPFTFSGGGAFPGSGGNCVAPLNPNTNNQCSFIAALQTTSTGLTAGVQATKTFSLTYNGDGSQGSGTLNFQLTMTPQLPPTLSFVSPAGTFGTLADNDSSTIVYTIKNNSPFFSAAVTGISVSGTGFTQTNNCPASLAKSATCQVSVTFKPTAATSYNGALTVNYNDQLNAQSISTSFTGTGSSNVKLTATPTTVDFGSVYVGDTIPTRTITLKYYGLSSWTSSFTAPSPFSVDASACGGQNDCNLTISYNPTVAGTSNSTMSFVYSPAVVPDSSGPTSAAITLTFKGSATVRSASLSLTPLTFKKSLLGSSFEQDLVLKNTGVANAKDFAFSLPSTTPMPFAIQSGLDSTYCTGATVLAPNQTCKLRVSFAPVSVGSASAALSVAFTNVGTGSSSNTSFTLTGIGTVPIQVFAGAFQTCMINELQKAVCWGNNAYGQLGRGNTSVINAAPQSLTPIAFGTSTSTIVKKIAVGVSHVCAIVDSGARIGAVSCWGNNDKGRLGIGSSAATSLLPPTDGSGNPAFVNLGTDSNNNPLEAIDLSAGFEHTCAVFKNGKVKCWGGNSSGQLGIGSTNSIGLVSSEMGNNLQAVDLAGVSAIQVSSGAGHSCAVMSDGNAKCWGDNFYGQLGQAVSTIAIGSQPGELSTLKNIDLGSGLQASAVSATEGAFTCVTLKNGSVKCFGKSQANEDTPNPFNGILGACWARASYNSPAVACSAAPNAPRTNSIGYYTTDMGNNLVAVALGANTVIQLVSGNRFSCVLMSDHSVRCWGTNERGQLGNGTTNNIGANASEMGSALAASLSTNVGVSPTSIAAGAEHACAVLSNNTLKCWGGSTDNATGLKSIGVTGDQSSASSVVTIYDGNI